LVQICRKQQPLLQRQQVMSAAAAFVCSILLLFQMQVCIWQRVMLISPTSKSQWQQQQHKFPLSSCLGCQRREKLLLQ
jgi:hypothetical protein